MTMKCPTCGEEVINRVGLRLHHEMAHLMDEQQRRQREWEHNYPNQAMREWGKESERELEEEGIDPNERTH